MAQQNQNQQDLREILQIRRDKLAALQEAGMNPFEITRYDVTHHAQEVKDQFDQLEGQTVSLAGRLMSKRGMGKVSFCDLKDKSGRIQIYARKDEMDEAEYDRIVSELLLIPTKLEQILDNRADIQYFASLYFNHPSIFFIGRNIDYAIGMEGSLKLKEISYIHSEAYAAGELKHGTISLIEPGTLVVALASYVKLFDKTMSNVVEVKSRGADVLGLTVDARAADMAKTVDHVIPVPDTHPLLLPSLDVVPMQLFAYYVALQRGCDIDKPRNLAKSVTVE